jgi:hypothetical protein
VDLRHAFSGDEKPEITNRTNLQSHQRSTPLDNGG